MLLLTKYKKKKTDTMSLLKSYTHFMLVIYFNKSNILHLIRSSHNHNYFYLNYCENNFKTPFGWDIFTFSVFNLELLTAILEKQNKGNTLSV